MKKFLLALVLGTVFSATAMAAQETSITYHTTLKSGYIDGFGKVSIELLPNGILSVYHDRNHCSPQGMCTLMAFRTTPVIPTIIEDSRSTDGDLVLSFKEPLGETTFGDYTLRVGSGNRPDGKITYTLSYSVENTAKSFPQIELESSIRFKVVKRQAD